MAAMTGPERLIAALRGQPVDRVPIYLLYPPGRHPSYVDVHHLPAHRPVVEAALARTEWFHRVPLSGKVLTGGSPPPRQVKDSPEGQVWARETPLGRLSWGRQRRGDGWVKIPRVKEPEDFRRLLAVPWEPPTYDFSDFFRDLHSQPEWAVPMTQINDGLGGLYEACRHEDLAVWAVTEADLVETFVAEMHRRELHRLRSAIAAGLGGVFFLFGTEFAAPPMCSPKTFERLVARYDAELVQAIHDAGGLCPAHHHGRMLELLPLFRAMGVDGVHPIEAPPVGDCPAAAVRPALGERFCVMGNIQYDDLARLPGEAIRQQVFDLLDACGPFGVIVCPTAGPYEEVIPPRMVENYTRLIDAVYEWSETHLG